MNREPDDELREWREAWQADPEPSPDVRDAIRRRVRKKSLAMALAAAGEVLFGLAMLAFVARSALRLPTPVNVAAMACFALLILWALGCSLWYLRGTWRPSSESTAAFVALSLLRHRRRLRAVRAGWWLLLLELAVMVPWIVLALQAKAAAFTLLAALTILVAAFLLIAERWARRGLRDWEEVRASLGMEE